MNEELEAERIIKAKIKEAAELIEEAGICFPESITVETVSAQKLSEEQPRRVITKFEIAQ